jgi:hypothetical protein
MVITILSKLGREYSVFVSTFHSFNLASGATWKIPSLEAFIESLTQEHTKLINMGKIKGSKVHALPMKDGSSHQNQKSKQKEKWTVHESPKKEGSSKPFNDSSISKGGKGRKGEKCIYCQQGFHPESACMQKKIDQMAQILQQNNLGYFIPKGVKNKKPEDLNPKKGNSSHALIAIKFSLDAWIVDSGASHHMESTKEF